MPSLGDMGDFDMGDFKRYLPVYRLLEMFSYVHLCKMDVGFPLTFLFKVDRSITFLNVLIYENAPPSIAT